MRDLLILSDERRSDDLAGLTEVGSILRATAGIKTQIQAVPASNTAESNRLLVRQIDPSGSMQGFAWGNVALPLMHMSSPDGHNEEIYLASEEPYAATSDNAYAAAGNTSTSGAPFYIDTTQEVRPFGVVNLENEGGFYSDYLTRLNDYLAGRTTFEPFGVSADHLLYRQDITPHGPAMRAQFAAAYGAANYIEQNEWDSLDTGIPIVQLLGGHRPTGVGLFSGGQNFDYLYYLLTADTALQNALPALFIAIFGSTLMAFTGAGRLLPALLKGALSVFWTGYAFPDLSRFLAGQETLGEAVIRHANTYGRQGEVNLMGFPGLMRPLPLAPPIISIPTGVPLLSNDQVNAINASVDAKIAAMHDALQADYTAKINAAVLAMQTSQGQTGSPTGTVPPAGTSGTPPVGTGAVPALVINCGAADSLSAKSGFVWLNLPEASVAIDLTSVAVPLPIGVYHSGRGGPRAEWAFPGYPAGALAVRLDFNEPHWVQPGNRLQDVIINGVKVLSGFDIVSVSGALNKAVSKSFTAQIGSDGVLSIVLTATPGSPDANTYLCAIGIG